MQRKVVKVQVTESKNDKQSLQPVFISDGLYKAEAVIQTVCLDTQLKVNNSDPEPATRPAVVCSKTKSKLKKKDIKTQRSPQLV